MIRFFNTLWLLVKLGLFVGACAFLAYQPGETHLTFGPYELNARTGVLLVAVLAAVLVFTSVLGWIAAIGRIPAYFRRKREQRQHRKGLEALASGFGALAAGDGRRAGKWAQQAKTMLADDGAALSTMLEGLSAKQTGDVTGAERAFSSLLNTKETMSFGLRGLLSMAGEDGQTQRALTLAKEAMKQKHADQGGLSTLIYTLALKEKDWMQAREALSQTLKSAPRGDRAKLRTELAALELAQAREAKDKKSALQLARAAFENAPDSTAAALTVVELAMDLDETKIAQRAIETVWPRAPHPQLATAWRTLAVDKGITKPAARLSWMETLTKLNPTSTYGYVALAEEYIAQQMTGQARHALTEAAKIRTTAKLAQLLSQLNAQDGEVLSARTILADALDARATEGWVCTVTGRRFDDWQPVVWPDGIVGTVQYREDMRDITPLDGAASGPVALRPALMGGL